jgi:Domain of unknown function (DUF4440)
MILLACAAALMSPQPADARPPYSEAQAEQELREVIKSFGEAIIRKDAAQFLALFADGPVTWRSVDSDALLAKEGWANPKAAYDPARTPRSFIERIAHSPESREEETFSNIRIEHDEDIAAITFDFTYRVNDRSINEGKESWHLVRTEAGWRIVSVIYSNNDPVP